MVLLVEVLHIPADFVEKSCHFAYILHQNADSVEKSLSADTYIASLKYSDFCRKYLSVCCVIQ